MTRRRGSTSWTRALGVAALVAGACLSSSCAPSGFASESTVSTLRILASSAEPAYAQPGSTVTVQVLVVDGQGAARQNEISWLPFEPPFECLDPPDDAYYACLQRYGGGDGGAPSGGDGGANAPMIPPPGTDLTPFLGAGPSYTFTMPSDAVSSHSAVPGEAAPYGLAILFNFACAGKVEPVAVDPNSDNPQAVPVGCFDDAGAQLGPDDWVLGLTRVYAFEADAGADGGPITNANPVISSIDVDGMSLAAPLTPNTTQVYVTEALTTPRCAPGGCADIHIGPVVPAESWEEIAPQTLDVNGKPLHEEIWADYYSTFGTLSNAAGLLYDPTVGSIGGPSVTDTKFSPPSDPGSGFIWIVVHDNRGGASWVTIPVTVQ